MSPPNPSVESERREAPTVAVCSWSLRPRDPADLAARVVALGLDQVQIALGPCIAEAALWGDAAARLADAGIRIVSGMMATAGEDYTTLESIARTGGVRPDATWEANRRLAETVADLASAWGLELVTFHAGFIPESRDDPERGVLLDRLRTVADIFAARGVRLGLETGQESAPTLIDALDELDRPGVGVNFDPANMILYGMGDPVQALRTLAPRVVQIHVKDAVATTTPGTWGREVCAGTGEVDWPAFFELARAIEPPVAFVIEREAGEDRRSDVRAAVDLIRRLHAEAIA